MVNIRGRLSANLRARGTYINLFAGAQEQGESCPYFFPENVVFYLLKMLCF